jgi:hypothetical protein
MLTCHGTDAPHRALLVHTDILPGTVFDVCLPWRRTTSGAVVGVQ